ncbi:ABC transporter [Microbacterium mangrovi]|uniref:ABC transporter n=1 Tax=Microbacterium mangrovi TaxID=1348253 RepID=A0A0B1ZZ98_9MICO|nr:ABC transporter [Microbacterium mangrovi]
MIEARELGFDWSPRMPVLDNWSAAFESGTMTALTGPSGRGKSTLLYLLGLMLRPTHGQVLIDGEPASALPDAARARIRSARFGFVFQDAALDSTRTVIDNVTEVALYRGDDRQACAHRARELLERFSVDVPPLRKPTQVSGGQAQRIALCRALLSRPLILLADEPTGNLDPATTRTVVGALAEHAHSGATVIVVTHSPAVAAACDREIPL